MKGFVPVCLYLLLLVGVICVSGCPQAEKPSLVSGVSVRVEQAGPQELRVHLTGDLPEFVEAGEDLGVCLSGTSPYVSPGDPLLVQRAMRLALPPDADLSSIEVSVVDAVSTDLHLDKAVQPSPPAASWDGEKTVESWGEGKDIVDGRNMRVYGRDAFYPESCVSGWRPGSLRDWRVVELSVVPLQYNPVTKVLRVVTAVEIAVRFSRMGMKGAVVHDGVMDDVAAELMENFAEAKTWYPAAGRPKGTTYPYVILTTNGIVDASLMLSDFEAAQESAERAVLTVTEDGMYADLDGAKAAGGWGGGVGDVAAENLRAWLQDNYESLAIQYVLLIGNPNPGDGNVPMKIANPQEKDMPTDFYYGELSGNWDVDGDGIYGELSDDFFGGMDALAEVYVGRIPHYAPTTTLLDGILLKTISYMLAAANQAWRTRMLIPMEPVDDRTMGHGLGQALLNDLATPNDWDAFRLYDEDYGFSPEQTPCTQTNVLQEWQEGYGLVTWLTHGSSGHAADVFETAKCPLLDDSRPSFTFQCSCDNGHPENSSNLGYSLLKNGAVATVSAARSAWYSAGDENWAVGGHALHMTYVYAGAIVGGERAGKAISQTRASALDEMPMDSTMLNNGLVFNLYGDPAVRITGDGVGGGMIQREPRVLDIYVLPGEAAPSQTVDLWSVGGDSIGFAVTEVPAVGWMSCAPVSGTLTGEKTALTVSFNTPALAVGVYETVLRVTGPAANSPVQIPVTLHVQRPIPSLLDTTDLTWETGGSGRWVEDLANTHDGVDALRNDALAIGKKVSLSTTVTGPGTLSFWYRMQAEMADIVQLYVDGKWAANFKGEQAWQQYTRTLDDGAHRLQWTFENRGTAPEGADTFWLDQVSFTPETRPYAVMTTTQVQYEAGQSPEPVPVDVWNATQGTLNYTLSLNVDWLRISGTSGTSSGEVDRFFLEAVPGLFPPPGPTQQTCTLTLTAPGAANAPLTRTITVAQVADYVSLGEGLDAPELPWRTSGHAFWRGSKEPSNPTGDLAAAGWPNANKTSVLSVTLEGPGTFTFWRQVMVDYGSLSFYIDGELQGTPLTGLLSALTQEQYELPPGEHELKWVATRTVDDPNTWFKVVVDNVTYEQRLAKVSVAPESLAPVCQPGQDATSQTFEVWNSGNTVLEYSILSSVPWMSVSPSSGSSTGEHDTVAVTYDTSGLPAGIHTGEIRVSKVGEASSLCTIPVRLDIGTRAEVTLTPVKDNTLYEDATGSVSNGAGEYIVVGKYSGAKRRGLLAFDLSGIPPTAAVGEASLEVDVQGSVHAVSVSLFRAGKAWGEGTSNAAGNETVGVTRTKHDATWTYSDYNTALWTTPGGDFAEEPTATRLITSAGVYTWESSGDLVDDVQSWVARPATNFGWVLVCNEKTNLTTKQILSRQNGDVSRQPKLHVAYYVSAPATAAVPDVVGEYQSDAVTAIEAAGLNAGAITHQFSDTAPKYDVISQNPAAGTMVVPGADVDLVVSKGPSHIAVPSVVGQLPVTADLNLRAAGLNVSGTTNQYTTVESGRVARQTPAAGTIVEPGTGIALVVSLGSGNGTVPNVVGLTQAAARMAITDAWFTVGTVTQANSTTVAPGIVISQNRHPGAALTTGTTIGIVVSIGPVTTVVPDLTGLAQQPALDAIAAAHLQRGDISYGYSDLIPADLVMAQTREPGTVVEEDSVLSFVLSKGPRTHTVPDVVGMAQSAAETALVEAGLTVGEILDGFSETVAAGSVMMQEPAAGEMVAMGMAVDLVISRGAQSLRVTAPNGGELWVRGSRQTITWTTTFSGGLVKVKLFKGGVFHSWISGGAANTGSLGWVVPESLTAASDYTIQVYSASDYTKADVSDAPFSIINSPLQLTSPNGGERWYPGTKHDVTWNSTDGSITSVKIKLYKGKAMQGWISGGTPNDGTFTWQFPATLPLGDDYKVLIYAATDAAKLDYSDASFSMAAPPITLVNPNGGERFLPGDPVRVTWKSEEGAASLVKIKLFKNNVFHSWVSGGTANDGEFAWNMPADAAAGVDYQMQIYSATDFSILDYGDATFSVSADRLRLTSPNYGERWIQGTNREITWVSDGTVGTTVKVKLFKNGVFNRWINGGTPNDGSLMWTVPADVEPGGDYRIQVYSATVSGIVDFSDGYFSIMEPPLQVTYPNGGEMLTRDTPLTITWNSAPGVGDTVKLKLFKGGVLSRWISGGTPNDGSHTWPLPPDLIPGTDYTVQVYSATDFSAIDVSDSVFSIDASYL